MASAPLERPPILKAHPAAAVALLAVFCLNATETGRNYAHLLHPAAALHDFFTDFKTFYACALLWSQGHNPYDQALVSGYLERTGLLQAGRYNFFLYPPWALYLFRPLASLSFSGAATVAVLGGSGGLGTGIWLWFRSQRLRGGVGLGVLYLLVGPWNTANILQGQLFNLLAFNLLACMYAFPKRQGLIGILLGLLLAAKPGLLPIIGISALLMGHGRALVAAGLAAIVTYTLAALSDPAAQAGYIDTMAGLPHLYLPWHGQVSEFCRLHQPIAQ